MESAVKHALVLNSMKYGLPAIFNRNGL
jgi:hypothetical protein